MAAGSQARVSYSAHILGKLMEKHAVRTDVKMGKCFCDALPRSLKLQVNRPV